MLRHCTAILMLAATIAAAADNPETLVERSQARARTVLDRAVEALGGAQGLRAIDTVRIRLEGQTWPRLQMPTASPPFEGGTLREGLLLDLKNNRLLLEQRGSGFGFENHNTIVIRAGQGTNYDHRARTATAIPAAQSSQQQFVQYYRRLPNLILRQALNGITSLRHLGEENFEGRPHEVITFVMPDTQQVALYVDADSGLISKYELAFADALAGDDASEILFGDYARTGSHRVPRTFTQRLAGEVGAKFNLQVEVNPPAPDRAFEVAASGYAEVEPLPLTLEENVEKLAEGVFLIQNVAGQNQHTLAVAFEDHVLVVEAPGSSDGADQVIERIAKLIPGKPVRYVAMTHHHGDHIGGLRSFIAEGATVITTPGNREVVQTMAAAAQNDRLAKNPRKAQLLLVEKGRRVLSDDMRTVELIDIGPNPHAKEMVIAYLPKERLVFQGDLFFAPVNDAPQGPPQASTVSFARKLKALNLSVDRIAGVHGRMASMADFLKATSGGT